MASSTPFAGTNRIRFRGSAVVRTLSATVALPCPVCGWHRESYTQPGRSGAGPRAGDVLDSWPCPRTPIPPTSACAPPPEQRGVSIEIVRLRRVDPHGAGSGRRHRRAAGPDRQEPRLHGADRPGPGRGDLEPVIALVRGTDRVDVGKLASAAGRPRLRRATAREARAVTGYAIGGVPPFGHERQVAVVMDPALDGYEEVWAAAGTPTTVFAIAPATLAMLSDALVAPCAEDRRRCRSAVGERGPALHVGYPGGLAARYRWGGSGLGAMRSSPSRSAVARSPTTPPGRRRPDAHVPRRAARRGPAGHVDRALRLARLRRARRRCCGTRKPSWW